VLLKLPTFFACSAWTAANGLELPLEHPASASPMAAARKELQARDAERAFIFMATD
jgi:hypothetical protein